MTRMNKLLIVCGMLILLIFFCTMCVEKESGVVTSSVLPQNTQEEGITIIDRQRVDGYSTDLRVLRDNKRKVTCWKLAHGMSCIPDHLLQEIDR